MKLWGVTGWKNSGKTGLMERLVTEFTARGLTVSTIKHAHHSFDVDHKGRDSYRHREAGAKEVLLSSRNRWALMHETRGEDEATLDELLTKLSPVDLVLIEGFKREAHPKIEAHRSETGQPLIAPNDPTVKAVASDSGAVVEGRRTFDLDDTKAIADFIWAEVTGDGRAARMSTHLPAFDSFAVVDWSSGNDTGPTPRKDAIWAALVVRGEDTEPVYLRNRGAAFEWICDVIACETAAHRRLMIGFDFPFGYPAGFAQAVTGSNDPLALWHWFAEHLVDTPKANNRFDLAGMLNGRFPGTGPFWFNALKRDISNLPRKGTDRHGHGMADRRAAEMSANGAFTCWQMGGAGAVGGQVMTGLATLERLRRRFPGQIAVWPFEPLVTAVSFVEIWPSLSNPAVQAAADPIKDRAQVRLLARALSRLSSEQLGAMLACNAPEEGWILGLGHEALLSELAR